MEADDGWPKVWAEMTDEELRDRLRHYMFLAATGPLQHAKRIAQLVAEANKRGKAEMVDEATQWVKSHKPAKQELCFAKNASDEISGQFSTLPCRCVSHPSSSQKSAMSELSRSVKKLRTRHPVIRTPFAGSLEAQV